MNYTITFVDIASTRVADLQAMMTTVIGAERTILLPIIKSLATIFLLRQFLLLTFAHMTMERIVSSFTRVLIIVLLIQGAGNFNTFVVNRVFTNMPQMLSNMGVGSYAPGTTGKSSTVQFDAVSAAGDALAEQIRSKSTCWSVACATNSFTAYCADGAFQMVLCGIFGVWFLGLNLMAIALCMGQIFLCFEFFDRTRGFLDQWIGKIIGFGAFGFAASIVLALEMQSMQTMINKLNGLAGTNVDAAVSMFIHAVGSAGIDFLLIIACPIAFGFGSGAVAALAAPAAMAATGALRVSAGVAGGGAKAAGAAARLAARSAGSRI